ncbi:MAG: YbjN domain-containing protein [Clostridiales bacterium]|nr:YbjN domain-containing protein [Clostridiales bacterium]
MSDEKELKHAQTVYSTLCNMLDEHGWHYEKHDEDLSISCAAQGDDLPIDLHVEVDMKRHLITLLSKMPFSVAPERRAALAVAVSQANNGMVDGSFDYDYTSGRIIFRMTSSYLDSLIGKDLMVYMVMCSCKTIDDYNDKFLMVAKSEMTNEEILEFIK